MQFVAVRSVFAIETAVEDFFDGNFAKICGEQHAARRFIADMHMRIEAIDARHSLSKRVDHHSPHSFACVAVTPVHARNPVADRGHTPVFRVRKSNAADEVRVIGGEYRERVRIAATPALDTRRKSLSSVDYREGMRNIPQAARDGTIVEQLDNRRKVRLDRWSKNQSLRRKRNGRDPHGESVVVCPTLQAMSSVQSTTQDSAVEAAANPDALLANMLAAPAGNAPLDAEAFRRAGHALIDWIAQYREHVGERAVAHLPPPGSIRAMLPVHAPEQGEAINTILADLDRVVMPGIVHWQHPGWFAYFPANSSYESILGELASAGLGVQGMLWSTSPACTELETHVLDWLVQALGLPAKFLSSGVGGGVLQDTASSAALVTLVAARERATEFAVDARGLAAHGRAVVAYTSDQAHSSIEKAARIAGFGKEFLRLIPVDDRGAMRADMLEAEMRHDLEHGHLPAFVCATVGTTGVQANDPIERIARVCASFRNHTTGHAPWLHIDAAMSGTAALCEEFRFVTAGAEHADSWCFNPHKWMPVNFDCDALWVADRATLVRALSVLPEYLRNNATASGQVIDYRDWQVPLGRRFRALKLWFVLRSFGLEGLRALVRRHVGLARGFADEVEADPHLRLIVQPTLNLVALAHRDGDDATQRLIDRVNSDGRFFISHCRFHGTLVLRVSIGALATTSDHVDALFALIAREARS